MKLWMSGEIMAEVADAYRSSRNEVESRVNERLISITLKTPFEKWAFIAILRPDDHPDYPEIIKKHSKRKVLEFRLKIDYEAFAKGDSRQQQNLIIDTLKRSVEKMPELDVEEEDCAELFFMLDDLQTTRTKV